MRKEVKVQSRLKVLGFGVFEFTLNPKPLCFGLQGLEF